MWWPFRKPKIITFIPGAEMRAKDAKLWDGIKDLSAREGLIAWFSKYPEDVPDGWRDEWEEKYANNQSG